MKLAFIILVALPLAAASSSSSQGTNIRGSGKHNRELWSWGKSGGNDGYNSDSGSCNPDGYTHTSSTAWSSGGSSSGGGSSWSSSSHSSSKPKKVSTPKPKPRPKPPKPAPKPKRPSPSPPSPSPPSPTTHTSWGDDAWKDDNWGDDTWEDDAWKNDGHGDWGADGHRQSSMTSSKVAHHNGQRSSGVKLGLVLSLLANVVLAAVFIAKKVSCVLQYDAFLFNMCYNNSRSSSPLHSFINLHYVEILPIPKSQDPIN